VNRFIVLCFILFLFTTPCLSLFTLNEKSYWSTEIVDDEGNTGRYTSIDIDSRNYPHISYCREDNGGFVKYAYWNGVNWILSTIDKGFDYTFGNVLTTSICLDSNDYPHIAYAKPPNMVNYASWNGTIWNIETIYTGNGIYGSVGLILDSNDNPHISYCDGLGSFVLRYAHRHNSEWSNDIIDNIKSSGFHNSISIDSNDCVHIAYSNIDHKEIKYAVKNSSTLEWKLESVDSTILGFPNYPSIDIDSHNLPHIGYYDSGKEYNYLKYAHKNSSTLHWISKTIIADKPVGNSYSLAISDLDDVYLMYQNIESKDLELIYWNDTKWISEIIDFEGLVGCCSDISIAPYESAYVSYRDEEFGNLKFAFKNIKPSTPVITGPSQGKIGEEITFTLVGSDANNHFLNYHVIWDDDTEDMYIGPVPSNEKQICSHIWEEQGEYTIKVKAIDSYGAESDWGECMLSMPKNKVLLNYKNSKEFGARYPLLFQFFGNIARICKSEYFE